MCINQMEQQLQFVQRLIAKMRQSPYYRQELLYWGLREHENMLLERLGKAMEGGCQ